MPKRFAILAVFALLPFTAFQNGKLPPAPFLDIGGKLVTERAGFDERGLIGLAFHPEYGSPLPPGYRRSCVLSSRHFIRQL